jgi:ATP-dependent DNA helicase RecQ
VESQFGDQFEIVRGSLARPGLSFAVFRPAAKSARLARLLEIARGSTGTGIVYCLTIPETKRVADFLASEGIKARNYHGGLSDEERLRAEAELRVSDVDVVVATSALGMGFDKPDIEYVVHLQSPASIVEYYQQAGRAGRGIPHARAELMVGDEDLGIHAYFASLAFVTEFEADRVFKEIASRGRATQVQLESVINIETERLEKVLKLLDVEGAIEKAGFTWTIASPGWTFDHARPERVTAQRRLERRALYAYAASDACRVRMLMEQLDDPHPVDCGECDNCIADDDARGIDERLTQVAESFLSSFQIRIAPKRLAPRTSRNRPYPIHRHAWGRALCFLGEGELGTSADCSITRQEAFDETILEATVDLLDGWRFKRGSEPQWVSFVPKDKGGDHLEELARLIAKRIGKPFRPALTKTRETRSALELRNDVQRYENLSFAFEPRSGLRTDPVLMIDDMVYSGWTFAVAAMTLRKQANVEAVLPFAVARVL